MDIQLLRKARLCPQLQGNQELIDSATALELQCATESGYAQIARDAVESIAVYAAEIFPLDTESHRNIRAGVWPIFMDHATAISVLRNANAERLFLAATAEYNQNHDR